MATKPSKAPKRSPLEDTLSVSLPKRLKRSVAGRAKLLDRPISQLLRFALEYHDGQSWKDIEFGVLSPGAEGRLRKWLESGEPIDSL